MYVHFYINFRRCDDRATVQVTASTAAAIKFIEASPGLANGAEDLS
jgi:hypothetical protein